MSAIVHVLRAEVTRRIRARELDAAAEALERLEAEDPLAVETRGLRLELLLASGRNSEAAALARQLAGQFPGSARIQLLGGRAAYAVRDYETALGRYEESNRLFEDRWTSRLIGATLTQLGRFAEAEARLLALLPAEKRCFKDLAWLYERQEQPERALEAVESYLLAFPEDQAALGQRLRLRARLAEPARLVAEVQALLDLDEPVAPDLLPEFCDTLLRSGRTEEARAFVAGRRGRFDERTRTRVAWVCYKLQVYDLALDLFLDASAAGARDAKLETAMETAARRTGQVERVIELYESRTASEPRLFGRITHLRRMS
ncbi:MAG: hypothetical protein HY812_18395 [Planctomycetes bacterium]|nr:hypothetical protein [Planctomycetota bacterium]